MHVAVQRSESSAQDPLPAPSAIGSGSTASDGPREIVVRPDGMRKGVWEASPTFFYVAASALGLLVVGWLLFRFGVLKLPKRKRKPEDEPPKSSRRKAS